MVASAISSTKVGTSKTVHHHVFDKLSQTWQQRRPKKKPMVKLKVRVDHEACKEHGIRSMQSVRTHEIIDSGMADSGASVSMGGPKFMRSIGLSEADLAQSDLRLYGADDTVINLIGMVPVVIVDNKTKTETRQFVYINVDASTLLLSLEACQDLGYVSDNFPDQGPEPSQCAAKSGKNPECDCKCPTRERAPDVPANIPIEPTPENIPKLEQWIRDYYASSAFNCCECQPLRDMHGPPVKIHLTEDAKPVASHSPIPVPLHWHKKVKAGLDRDVAIGVLQKVPAGTPTTWCHKMVCVPKKDGSPRRTVNFVPLNQFSFRQTHHTMSPFHQASMVPSNTYKTVLDAWNGYHSCLLDEESRPLTCFISPCLKVS